MKRDTKFRVPRSFKNYLDKKEEEERIAAKRAQEQERKKQIKRSQQQPEYEKRAKKIKRQAAQKLEYAKMIFEWARNFTASKTGKRVIASLSESRLLCLFSWQRDYSLHLCPNNVIRWYQWGPGSKEKYCETPEKLAHRSKIEFLKAACDAIKNGEIWEHIQEDLDVKNMAEEKY